MQRGNFVYMLIGLLLLVLIGPSLSQLYPNSSSIITTLAFQCVMIVGVWSLNINNRWFIVAIILMIVGLLTSGINVITDSKLIYLFDLTVSFLFCVLSIMIAMQYILFSGSITTNKIIGSICIYILLGVVWGQLFIFLDVIDPGAFNGLTINSNDKDAWNFIYYSFVTLTTLGYGDISPVSQYARSLSYLEAICGQIFIAVLVASLVGAHLADRKNGKE